MPRPILVPTGTAGIATYELSAHDEWTLLALTVTITDAVGMGGTNFAWLDLRDPSGGIIYRQPLTPGDGGVMFYSLATNASEFVAEPAAEPFWPQQSDGSSYKYVSQGLAVVTLYTGCTVNVYKTAGSEQPPTDPITAVDTDYVVSDLHLWVDDVQIPDYTPPKPPTPILVHAPEFV